MNLILLLPQDFINPTEVNLTGRRLQHVRSVHRAQVGDTLRVGALNGLLGQGVVTQVNDEHLTMAVTLSTPPPAKLALTLVLALPRPKVLNRVLAAATALGVAHITLLNSFRVEKGYWTNPRLGADNLLLQRLLGLEQAQDTGMPSVDLQRRFKPFVEDELGTRSAGTLRLVAHPEGAGPCPRAVTTPVTLVVGPEGGFIPFEVELLQKVGFAPVSLGPRILRVETAVATLVGRLF